MDKNSIKRFINSIRHFNLVIIPNDPNVSTKNYKLSSLKVFIILFIYSITIFLGGFYFLTIFKFNDILLPESYIQSLNREEIRLLNEKIIKLATELEELQIRNRKLKTLFEKQDSLKKLNKDENQINKKPSGSIYLAFKKFLRKFFNSYQEEIIFIKPVEGILSNKFDPAKGHLGIDFSAKENTPIYASANGYVSFAGFSPEYGYEIILVHSNNFLTKYKHCSVLLKKEGDKVIQGELIALVGNTGLKSHGHHLHFEIWKNGKPVNPENFLLKF